MSYRYLFLALSLALAGGLHAGAEIVLNLGLGLPGQAAGATQTTITYGSGSYSTSSDAHIIPLGVCLDADLELGHSVLARNLVFGLGLDYKTLGSAMLRLDPEFALGARDMLTAYTYLRLNLSFMHANIRGGLSGGLDTGPGPYLGLYGDIGKINFGVDIALINIRSAEGQYQPAGEKYDFDSYAGYSLHYRHRLDKPAKGESPYFEGAAKARNAAIWGYGLGVPLAFAGTFLYLIFAR